MIWLILILLGLLLFAVVFIRFISSNHDTFEKMSIDSPPTSRLLGNFGQVIKQGIFQAQMEWYSKYKDKKVYGVYDTLKPIMIIRDLDIVKDITVKSFNNFVNRRVIVEFDGPFMDNLLTIKDDHWKYVRNIMSPTFSSGRIKRMSQHLERNSQRLVNILRAKQERNENVELKDIISHFTLDVIASTGFGLDINTIENPDNAFATNAKKCVRGSPLVVLLAFTAPWLLKLLGKIGVSMFSKESLLFFTKTIDSAMESRKEEGEAGKVNDFMDLLINAEKESGQSDRGSLTRSEIHGQVILFILAGYDTVSTVLSFTLFMLANHPECCQMLQKEIDEKLGNESPNYDNVQNLTKLDMCISETMRMYPPGFVLDRVCSDDITIQGIHIPKDMVVSFPVYAIHYDPEIWPEPEKFKPERFNIENKASRHPYAYLPFGHGPRNCIGMRLALLELKIALAFVLKSLTPVTCDKTVYPAKLEKFQMKALDGLWVKLNVRK
uniref:Cytochrome P450 n=1 Tax=Arion vulgaris TaxID=1028688 RepID=A0A0B7AHN9_9EUPU